MTNISDDTFPRLLGDIGGTHARFALQWRFQGPLTEPVSLESKDFPGPLEAIRHYLRNQHAPTPRWAALGLATPITGDAVALTNHPWRFSARALQQDLGLTRLELLNDFTALALALPLLGPQDCTPIGAGCAVVGKALALLGPGTGLGVSGLLPAATGYVAIEGEGGHVTLAAASAREAEILARAWTHWSHVSAERLLSGPGLELLYGLLSEDSGMRHGWLSAAEIAHRGCQGQDALCRETLDVFCAFLGTVAADLALTLGARGGVYLGGGILPQWGDYFLRSPFRARFESKGRYGPYLASIPTWLIQAPWPGLLGAAQALNEPFAA